MDRTMTYQLLNHPEFSKIDLNNLKSVGTGESRLHTDLRDKFERRANNVPFLTEGIYVVHVGERILTNRPVGCGLSECVCLSHPEQYTSCLIVCFRRWLLSRNHFPVHSRAASNANVVWSASCFLG
jgi:hypothetical protein